MRKLAILAVISLMALSALTQSTNSDEWTVGTIMDVKVQAGMGTTSSSKYDISVKVHDTVYVVLYVAAPGRTGEPYRVGNDLQVKVGSKKLTFLDVRGETKEVSILSSRKVSVWRDSKQK
jgi:hypothetical protein